MSGTEMQREQTAEEPEDADGAEMQSEGLAQDKKMVGKSQICSTKAFWLL
jgi:hypothetical protein